MESSPGGGPPWSSPGPRFAWMAVAERETGNDPLQAIQKLDLDSGATHTSAIPVTDGYVLQQAVVKSPLGGEFLTMQCKQFLEEQLRDKGGIVAAYQVAGE